MQTQSEFTALKKQMEMHVDELLADNEISKTAMADALNDLKQIEKIMRNVPEDEQEYLLALTLQLRTGLKSNQAFKDLVMLWEEAQNIPNSLVEFTKEKERGRPELNKDWLYYRLGIAASGVVHKPGEHRQLLAQYFNVAKAFLTAPMAEAEH
ncbi:MAG: hypothetical protein EOP04_03600 [Proteobacteria bacterium]|nr:MAG: hypothetical protein EOP04_03600 [Pseudomonadota bacterium]